MKKLLILMVMFVSPIFSQEIKSAGFSSSHIGILSTHVEQFIANNNISESDIINIQYAQSSSNDTTIYSVFLLYTRPAQK